MLNKCGHIHILDSICIYVCIYYILYICIHLIHMWLKHSDWIIWPLFAGALVKYTSHEAGSPTLFHHLMIFPWAAQDSLLTPYKCALYLTTPKNQIRCTFTAGCEGKACDLTFCETSNNLSRYDAHFSWNIHQVWSSVIKMHVQYKCYSRSVICVFWVFILLPFVCTNY